MASVYGELFSKHLQRGDQTFFTPQALGRHVRGVFVFFSANWNPVAREFVKDLVEFYKEFKEQQGEGIEIVFVSSDESQAEFNEHYRAMPWLALPYPKRNVQSSLIRRFKVKSLPTLSLVTSDGTLLARDCQRMVVKCLVEDCFLWTLSPLPNLLGSEFLQKDGKKVGPEELEGKTIGLYFSYWWEMESRDFTPRLAEFYREYTQLDRKFELVFYSCDKHDWRTEEYFAKEHGDYLCHPHGDFMTVGNYIDRVTLRQVYNIRTLPSLVILDPARRVVTIDGVSRVMAGAQAVYRQGWRTQVVGDLSRVHKAVETDINHCLALVVLCDRCPAHEQSFVEETIKPLARAEVDQASATGWDPQYIFFVARGGCMANHVRALTSKAAGDALAKAGNRPVTLLLNIPDGTFFMSLADPTVSSVKRFIKTVEAGRERKLMLNR